MAFDFSTDQNKSYLQAINQNAPDAGAALKVLSLNLPSFVGGSPIAPDALLRPGVTPAAQVGGTPVVPSGLSAAVSQAVAPPASAPAPSLQGPSAPPPVSAAVAAPVAPPPSPTGVSPFTTAPIAALAANALAPATTAPAIPSIQFQAPRPPAPAADPLGQLLSALLGTVGSGDDQAVNGPAQI